LGHLAGADIGKYTTFSGTVFGDKAIFDDTVFKGPIMFTGQSVELWSGVPEGMQEINAIARRKLEIYLAKLLSRFGSSRNRFITISFSRACFEGEANLSGRTFEGDADFTNARFYRPPDFDVATKDARLDFTGAHIGFVSPRKLPWTEDGRIPVRLRRIRKIAEETKNHDLERDLYIEERKAERGVYWRQLLDKLEKAPILEKPPIFMRLVVHCAWIIVMFGYWALADYGRSFIWQRR